MNKYHGFITYLDDSNLRLDVFLSKNIDSLSRSVIQSAVRKGEILVNKRVQLKSNYLLHKGDIVRYNITGKEIGKEDLKAQDIPLTIIFENEDVLVINKSAGMTVHPTPNNQFNTLVNALLNYNPDIINAVYDSRKKVSQVRPGIVHRLDKGTSGVMIVAKNVQALKFLSRQIKNRKVIKQYFGLCFGNSETESGQWSNYLGRNPHNRLQFSEVGESRGKIALTNFFLERSYLFAGKELSLNKFEIITGRTHQIRAQSLLHHCPILGDSIYYTDTSQAISIKLDAKRQMLHSYSLAVQLPGDNKISTFKAELPSDFNSILSKLTKN